MLLQPFLVAILVVVVFVTAAEDFDNETCPPVLDIVTLLDTSTGDNKVVDTQISWVTAVAKALPIHQNAVRMSLIRFAEMPITEFNMSRYSERADIIEHLFGMQFQSGPSRSGAALFQTHQELFESPRRNTHRVVIIFTQGLSTDSPTKAAESLRRAGVRIYAVCVGDDGFVPELLSITGSSDRIFGPVDLELLEVKLLSDVESSRQCKTPTAVSPALKIITEPAFDSSNGIKLVTEVPENGDSDVDLPKINQELLLLKSKDNETETSMDTISRLTDFASTTKKSTSFSFPTLLNMEIVLTTPKNQFSKPRKVIKKIIRRRRLKATTSTTMETSKQPLSSGKAKNSEGVECPMDILFIMDSSGSMGDVYQAQKDFLTGLIRSMEPSMKSRRVGLIQFAGPLMQRTEWAFDAHSSNADLLDAIKSLRHLSGTTCIGAALRHALSLLETRRKHSDTMVVLITDGFSRDDVSLPARQLRQLANVRLYAVSLANLTDTRSLTEIVEDRRFLFVDDDRHALHELISAKLRCLE